MEKKTVVIEATPEIIERIALEEKRQVFIAEINNLHKRIREAGFSVRVVKHTNPDKSMFGKEITIPISFLANGYDDKYKYLSVY